MSAVARPPEGGAPSPGEVVAQRSEGRQSSVDARPAVFIDKDGTLVDDLPYNVDADRLSLRPDAGEALAWLRREGYGLVLVSNQPGVARGLFPETALESVWERLRRELAPHGAAFDAIYYCPHHPDGQDPRYAQACDCRKPLPGLITRAAAEHGYDLARSWMIGDILDDVEAGRRAGCRTVLLDVGSETEWKDGPQRQPHFVATSLRGAAAHIVSHPVVEGSPGGDGRELW